MTVSLTTCPSGLRLGYACAMASNVMSLDDRIVWEDEERYTLPAHYLTSFIVKIIHWRFVHGVPASSCNIFYFSKQNKADLGGVFADTNNLALPKERQVRVVG